MKKFVLMFIVLNILTLLGLAGYLLGTGRLDKAKAQTIADMLKQQGTPEGFREKVYDLMVPVSMTAPATGPASRPALAMGPEGGMGTGSAEERIDYVRAAMEQERIRLEAMAQDQQARQKLLDEQQARVEGLLKRVDEQKKAFEAEKAKAADKGTDEAFSKTLALFEELKTKQVKDLLMGMPQDVVAKYIDAMAPERAAKVMGEFKTAEEKAFIQAIVERLRTAGTGAATGTRTASSAR